MQTETCQTNCTKFSIIEENLFIDQESNPKKGITNFYSCKSQRKVTTKYNKSDDEIDIAVHNNGADQKVNKIMAQKRNKLLTLKLEKTVGENFPSNQKMEDKNECEKFAKPNNLKLFSQQIEANSSTRFLSASTTMPSLGRYLYDIFFLFIEILQPGGYGHKANMNTM